MVQMDGSPHAWFEDRAPQCVLMTVIDDATRCRRGRFYPAETTEAAMDSFGRWCEHFGVPQSLYVDRHGIYRSDRAATVEELKAGVRPVTQFGRAMRELGVELIMAHSPQAKGRVEKSNGTMQDRLVKELTLAGISGIEQANAWLDKSGFFEATDGKFAVEAADPTDLHRPLVVQLSDVLCLKGRRSVGLDGCVQWSGRILQLQDAGGLRGVEVWERFDGTVTVMGGGRRLSWVELNREGHKALQAARRRAARPPIENNKRYKPGPHQQIRLAGSSPSTSTSAADLRRTG
jgi:hypothetical protein